MMETGRMTIVVALVHTVFLRERDTERFILEDGKMTKDMYVSMTFSQCKQLFLLYFVAQEIRLLLLLLEYRIHSVKPRPNKDESC